MNNKQRKATRRMLQEQYKAKTKCSILTVKKGNEVIGYVTVTDIDNMWVIGDFKAGSYFPNYSKLFDEEQSASDASDSISESASDIECQAAWDKLEAISNEIYELGLRVNGTRIVDFKFNGQLECEFKFHPNPEV